MLSHIRGVQSSRTKPVTLDDSLVARIAAGDQLAMQVFYARYNARIYRFALNIVHDVERAEDVVHKVFLDIWQNAREFKGAGAITRHKTLTILRCGPSKALDEATYKTTDASDHPEAAVR